MRYKVFGYAQEKLINEEVDLNGALILQMIDEVSQNMIKKKKHIIIGGKIYVWLTYGYIKKQLPIVGSERTVTRRIDELVKKGMLEKIVRFNGQGKVGKYMYIGLTEKYFNLLKYENE